MADEQKRGMLLIYLEAICLALIIPLFYWGTFRILLDTVANRIYDPHGDVAFVVALLVIVALNGAWLKLMALCPKKDLHAKIILTLLVLTLSVAVLSCFIVARALRGAFS